MTRQRPQKAADVRKSAGQGHGRRSDAMRERAVLALLSERTLALAAEHSGVHERTLRRWLTEDAAFRAEYETARAATFEAGMSRVQSLVGRAVETLEDLLTQTNAPAVRLGAARSIAELGIYQHDAETILRKLDAIETTQRRR